MTDRSNHPDRRVVVNAVDLSRYVGQLRSFPVLTREFEQELSRHWHDHHDISAAHILVSSHLRLVIKIARDYRGYGLSSDDLISEGQLGLMRAVCRFDPDRGVRFAAYALFWVRAAMQAYVMGNWSLVKVGTTSAQRKLFFNLRRARRDFHLFDDRGLPAEHVRRISHRLRVPERDIVSMDARLAGHDISLNAPLDAGDESDWQSNLADTGDGQEAQIAELEEKGLRLSLLCDALSQLSARERAIVVARRLRESALPLAQLSQTYGISKERVRQIETRAIDKLQRAIRTAVRRRKIPLPSAGGWRP